MNDFIHFLAVAAILGSGIIGGVFFAFSSFVMKALCKLPSSEGIAAMQSINVVVLNPSFLGAFIGTALLSGLIAVLAVISWGTPAAPWYLAGALLYVVGTFLVTVRGNVPLNQRLAGIGAAETDAVPVWEHYLVQWTTLNTIRTIAAAATSLLLTLGLLQSGSG